MPESRQRMALAASVVLAEKKHKTCNQEIKKDLRRIASPFEVEAAGHQRICRTYCK